MKIFTRGMPVLFALLALATGALAQDDEMSGMGSMSTEMPSMEMPSMEMPSAGMPSMDGMGGDARDLLGERAEEPDGTPDPGAGDSIMQTENAGIATMSMPSSGTSTSTTTHSHSSSSSFSIGIGVPAVDPNAPAVSFFPSLSTEHHSHSGPSSEVPVGPIWNEGIAQQKCPVACGESRLTWTGQWRTVQENVQSVCTCAAGVYGMSAQGRGGSCTAPPNHQCRGCSVSCPPGQAAKCTQGSRGIFTEPQSAICQTEATCECQ